MLIEAEVSPRRISQGEEGVLKIKITPRNEKEFLVSTHPEFLIKLNENSNISFSKLFFTASELNFQTKQVKDLITLDLEKMVEIPFKVKDSSLIGKQQIQGDVVFTAVFKDGWSLKTFQSFSATFSSKKSSKIRKKNIRKKKSRANL